MFGFSIGEIIVISVVALIALGPERIPHVARTIGRILAELRRATDEVKREFAVHDILNPNSPPYTSRGGGLRAEPIRLETKSVETGPADSQSHEAIVVEAVAPDSPQAPEEAAVADLHKPVKSETE